MQRVNITPGQVIFKHGDPSTNAYIIQKGRVEVVRTEDGVASQAVILGPGALFGEIDLLQGMPRKEVARALDALELEIISNEDFAGFYNQASPQMQKLISTLSSKVVELKRASLAASKGSNSAAGGESGVTALAGAVERVTGLLMQQCEQLETRVRKLTGENQTVDSHKQAQMAQEGVKKELQQLGPIQPLIDDETVNDILINGAQQVYVERKGKLELTDITFADNRAVLEVAHQIVGQVGRTLDPHRPLVDARLLDGSRVNIIAPPLAVDGPSVSIRKFSKKKLTLDIMVEQGNLSRSLAEVLKIIGKCRLNVIISGGTGSGKTTMLNAVSQHIGFEERIVTIEDAAELQLQQPHVVRLETKPLSQRGRPEDEVTMRDLVKNALRMRPDRIIVGEVRGQEAFDMMQAMNTGHEGSMSTIHANHPRDALSRLENMISMANLHIPPRSLREQITSALNLIVQISRMRDGMRRVNYVTEVVGLEGDTITLQELFRYEVTGEQENGLLKGEYRWTGIMPRFLRRAAYYGEYEHLSNALGVKLPKI